MTAPLACFHCGSPPRPFPDEPPCPECNSEPVKCFWKYQGCTRIATQTMEGMASCAECCLAAERDALMDLDVAADTERAPAIACNADLGHPCDAGGRDDNDDPIPCASCAADADYWQSYFRGMPRQPTREEYRADMIDSGHGHLLREDER